MGGGVKFREFYEKPRKKRCDSGLKRKYLFTLMQVEKKGNGTGGEQTIKSFK